MVTTSSNSRVLFPFLIKTVYIPRQISHMLPSIMESVVNRLMRPYKKGIVGAAAIEEAVSKSSLERRFATMSIMLFYYYYFLTP